MNKLIRLSPTGIEYGDCAWNFASGCGNNIDGKCKAGGFKCWAYSISQRFEGHYPNGFKPTIYPEALLSPLYLKKPSRILCAFMGDLFWNCPEFNPQGHIYKSEYLITVNQLDTLREMLFWVIEQCPQHTFLFLTKQPQNLIKWSPFPDNCWVGVSVTNPSMLCEASYMLKNVEAKIKYLSFEPLIDFEQLPGTLDWQRWIEYNLTFYNKINWVIIGSQTKPYKPPKIEWVKEIVEACDKAGIPVFLKDNLKPLIITKDKPYQFGVGPLLITEKRDEGYKYHLRQELPDGVPKKI